MQAFAVLVSAAAIFVGLGGFARAEAVKDAVILQQGLQLILQFSEPFSAASVGDPRIVDAMPRSDRIIILQGKEPGITDIVTVSDGKVLRQISVTVTPPSAAGKVITHNKRNLTEYTAYSCTDKNCARTKDDFEGRDVIIFGPGGTAVSGSSATSTINILNPPAAAAPVTPR